MNAFRLALLGFVLAGCATPVSVISSNYGAADALIAFARPQLDPDRPIIIATLVDIDDLERSSTLGRYVSESVSARFTQNRYRMVEMKLQNAVYMKSGQGELMLTRQVREIAATHQAQAIVVGTYSRASSSVFINLKVVKPESNIVIAAQDYSLRMNRDLCMMLTRDERACRDRWREYD